MLFIMIAENSIMAKFRVEYSDKQIRSITPAGDTDFTGENTAESRTGETIQAIIDADTEEQAREKAIRLQTELQTGKTKRELEGDSAPEENY